MYIIYIPVMSISQICVLLVVCSIIEKSLPNLMISCQQQTNCQNCIRLHQNCTWCYKEDYNLPRCNLKNKHKSCDTKTLLQSQDEKPIKISNKLFSNIDEAGLNAVQLRPQKVFVSLRKGIRTTVEFQYQAAKDYPLDLYYLTDLTWSMNGDLKIIKKLGYNISQALFDLTKSHKIAFGSYVDKPEMPFYLMDNASYENPCNFTNLLCEKGYLFKHKLNFTKYFGEFISKVNESKASANLDNLEGGLDAIMQIILCENQLGWMPNSRKIIVLVTESRMHLAGDGLLLGATRRNRKKCLIDSRGNYLQPIAFDYPSLEEIHGELKNKKINLIIASKNSSLQYYTLMGKLVEDSTYVGKLSQSSENIIDLVKTGYYNFMRKVSFFINTTQIEVLNVDIFADCNNTKNYIKTSSCENVEEEKAINFKVEFFLRDYPTTESLILYIEEKNIHERITIDVTFPDLNCNKCKMKSNKTCSFNGKLVCGTCMCNDGWKGELCDEVCKTDLSKCRLEDNGFTSSTCFGNGDCICEKCNCNLPFSGHYCQYMCPGFDNAQRTVCSGRGECFDGKCNCIGSFNGTDCSCSLDDDDCKTPGVNTCNSHGTCKCNSCHCDDGYSGAYCEICKQCDGFCNTYGPCLKRALDAKTDICQLIDHHRNSTTLVPVKENTILSENPLPTDCTDFYINDDGVRLELLFRYIIKDRNVQIEYQLNNATSFAASSITALIALMTVLGLGLCAIGLLKLRIYMREKAEYKRFRTEVLNATNKTNNEIYNSPMRNYEMPMQALNNHSKGD